MSHDELASQSKDIDLTTDPVSPSTASSGGVKTTPYTPDRDRERVRGRIAQWLLGLLFGIVAVVLFGIVGGWLPIDHLEKIGAVILSPIVALLGAVMGFYFGEQSRNRNS